MQIETGKFCPLLKKNCIELKCAWFTKLTGSNPQTGQPIDEWGCAIAWTPILLIENTQAASHTGEAVESLRNKLVSLAPSNLDQRLALQDGR